MKKLLFSILLVIMLFSFGPGVFAQSSGDVPVFVCETANENAPFEIDRSTGNCFISPPVLQN